MDDVAKHTYLGKEWNRGRLAKTLKEKRTMEETYEYGELVTFERHPLSDVSNAWRPTILPEGRREL